jgi:hypothetical protein
MKRVSQNGSKSVFTISEHEGLTSMFHCIDAKQAKHFARLRLVWLMSLFRQTVSSHFVKTPSYVGLTKVDKSLVLLEALPPLSQRLLEGALVLTGLRAETTAPFWPYKPLKSIRRCTSWSGKLS